ncbi:hypothetical protein AVEN_199656-1 [Araneus ventricosus]|uniref:Uncharacterized protein n=1 Tax=Araneus ventricosus TaxID=182803 RepID=A0A4Y2DFE0_ARAVE|nr:hypothetical protein AVEN_199656-1 [Araneus ventricosus]
MTYAATALSTEAGVLVPHHRATVDPSQRRYVPSLEEGTKPRPHFYDHRKTSSCLLIQLQLISMYSLCPPMGVCRNDKLQGTSPRPA